eukprot:413081_1
MLHNVVQFAAVLITLIAITSGGFNWGVMKRESKVVGTTDDFAKALNVQPVQFWTDSGDIDTTKSTNQIQSALPVSLHENELQSFLSTCTHAEASTTKIRTFWVSTELSQGMLQFISLESKNGRVSYRAIKAAISIPDHGEYKQDCKKVKKWNFKNKWKCGDKYFVSHGLDQNHLNLIEAKLQISIQQQPMFLQIREL